MAVVCVRGPPRTPAGERAEHALDGATVVEVLQAPELRYPGAGGWILDERRLIRRINVFVDGERGHEATAVQSEDRVEGSPAGAVRTCALVRGRRRCPRTVGPMDSSPGFGQQFEGLLDVVLDPRGRVERHDGAGLRRAIIASRQEAHTRNSAIGGITVTPSRRIGSNDPPPNGNCNATVVAATPEQRMRPSPP